MANYQTTKDIGTRALKKAGEPTNGNSSYSSSMYEYLSDVQRKLVAGSTCLDLNVDVVWPWAKADQNIVLEILPAYKTGLLSLTNGSNAGTFSVAPTYSVAGWFFRNTTSTEAYRIAYHTAGSPNFTLETPYLGATTVNYGFEAYKLDYEVLPQYIFVSQSNNITIFSENGVNSLTATVTPAAYTPTQYATALTAALNAGGGALTYTVTYSTLTRLFTISATGTFQLWGERGVSNSRSGMALSGFNFLDYTGATSYTGTYPFGSISRLIEPIKFYSWENGGENLVEGMDPLTFSQSYSYRDAGQGVPTYFTKIKEDNSGKITIRLNKFPEQTSRIEATPLYSPVDLQGNIVSVPLIPPKYYNFLEYAATAFVLLEKEDTKAADYTNLAKAELQAMKDHYMKEQFRTSRTYGNVAPRSVWAGPWYNRLRYGYDKDKY